jgi:hypothetical protein
LNDLIGTQQQRRRNHDTERFGRPAVDHKLELGRSSEWQVSRPGTAQDATSEIKISILIDEAYTELALRALHTAYGLDAA